MTRPTADLCDDYPDVVRVAEPGLRDFGAGAAFAGPAVTLRVPDDNSLVRTSLEEPGDGRVLVVDGGGHKGCALLGGDLAALAAERGWAGVVLNGCVRDTAELAACALGIKALASHPRRSEKRGRGKRDVVLEFSGVRIEPGDWVCSDADGWIVLPARGIEGSPL